MQNVTKNQKRIFPTQKKESTSLCALCRGTKFLCGKNRCPVIVRYHAKVKTKPLLNSLRLEGASPPSVFIGRIGYPKVAIGPMIPPVMGDTSEIDTPERWLHKTLDDIVDFRSQLVRGKFTVDVTNVESPHRIVEFTRELALSKNAVFADAVFEKKPYGKIAFYDEIQPHGPSAPLRTLDITNPKYEQHIEKAYYDTDLKARDAILDIYKNGVFISKIQRAFSVGAFGIKKNRRFVPTRWSITAVDSTLGAELMKKTKTYPFINEVRAYYLNQFDNRWIILMTPSEWQYELIEAWYPNTTWNQYGTGISIFNSYEFYEGRTTYAEIGGCYYAARLAVNELLNKERRQAGVVILREAHPGYIMPIGVWNVRESVRHALTQPPKKFNTVQESLIYVSEIMDIPVQRWIRNSAVLKNQLYQRKLEDFMVR
ncbi:MAG: Nre family DNA repair protein [Candidatus Thermoplasmatota archaeon]